MSIPAGFFESAYAIWADRAEAKRKGAVAWRPGLSTWEQMQRLITTEWKTAGEMAKELGRTDQCIHECVQKHAHEMNWRKVPRNKGKEWRMKGRELGVKG